MSTNHSIQLPKRILWYPGSSNDFYAALLPVLLPGAGLPVDTTGHPPFPSDSSDVRITSDNPINGDSDVKPFKTATEVNLSEVETQAEAQAKAQVETQSKAEADAKAEAQADAQAKAKAEAQIEAEPQLIAHASYLTTLPVVMNDADESLFQQLDSIAAPVTLYNNFQINRDFIGGSLHGWKNLGSIRIELIKHHSETLDLTIQPPSQQNLEADQQTATQQTDQQLPGQQNASTHTPRTASAVKTDAVSDPLQSKPSSENSDPSIGNQNSHSNPSAKPIHPESTSPQSQRNLFGEFVPTTANRFRESRFRSREERRLPPRIRIKTDNPDSRTLRTRLLKLELRITEAEKTQSIPLWFVQSDALDFIDTIAPYFGTHITGLALLRTRCPRESMSRSRTNFGSMVIDHLKSDPERYARLQFAWLDPTVAETQNTPWRHINIRKEEYENHDLPPRYFIEPSLRLREVANDAFYPGFLMVRGWGDVSLRYAQLYIPGHAYRSHHPDANEFPTYWVIPGLLMAGRWPGARAGQDTRHRIRQLLDSGIRTFVNLVPETESDAYNDLEQYRALADELAAERNLELKHHSMPMVDMSLMDDPGVLSETLTLIDKETSEGRGVYVHCRAGLGRTGVVVASWLKRTRPPAVRRSPIEFMNTLRYLGGINLRYGSPQSTSQFEFLQSRET
jgi:hypothetical protein